MWALTALVDYSPNPWANIVIRVLVEGVRGYDEDQVAFVIPDPTEVWLPGASYFGYTNYQPIHKHD